MPVKPIISFEQCKAFIDHQLRPQARVGEETRPFVTISRQAGAGGTGVARKLADHLQRVTGEGEWLVFDKALAEKVALDNALPKQMASYMCEAKVNFIESTVEELLGLHPPIEMLVERTAATVLCLAQTGKVILVGRGANVITARIPQGFHVRLVGSVERRAAHFAEWHGVTRQVAAQMLKVEDQGRRAYLKEYYGKDIEDPTLYHIVINTDLVSYDEAAGMIGEAVLKRMTPAAKPRLPYLEPAGTPDHKL